MVLASTPRHIIRPSTTRINHKPKSRGPKSLTNLAIVTYDPTSQVLPAFPSQVPRFTTCGRVSKQPNLGFLTITPARCSSGFFVRFLRSHETIRRPSRWDWKLPPFESAGARSPAKLGRTAGFRRDIPLAPVSRHVGFVDMHV